MRRLVFVGTVLSTFCVHAAAVLWNGVELQKDAYANGDVDYTLRWCSFYPDIPGVVDYYDLQVRMYVTTLNDNNVQRYALSSYNDDSAMGTSSNWLQSRKVMSPIFIASVRTILCVQSMGKAFLQSMFTQME